MKVYVLSVVGASLIAALVILLTPDGKGSGIGKHVKFLTSLALLCVIINPFLSFAKSLSDANFDEITEDILEDIPDGDPYENILYESLSEMSADELEQELENRICENFGIDVGNLEVNAEYAIEENSVRFKRITVILSGVAIFQNPYDVEAYVKELTGIDCKCLL